MSDGKLMWHTTDGALFEYDDRETAKEWVESNDSELVLVCVTPVERDPTTERNEGVWWYHVDCVLKDADVRRLTDTEDEDPDAGDGEFGDPPRPGESKKDFAERVLDEAQEAPSWDAYVYSLACGLYEAERRTYPEPSMESGGTSGLRDPTRRTRKMPSQDETAQAIAERGQREYLLKRIGEAVLERVTNEAGIYQCPSCGQHKSVGHADDCPLAEYLEASDEES